MKQILIISLDLISMSAKAQFSIGGGMGASTSKCAAGELQAGYTFTNGFAITGVMAAQVTSKVKDGNGYFLTAGYGIPLSESSYIEPSIGYGGVLRSSEQKQLNTGEAVYSLSFVHRIRYDAQLFIANHYFAKTFVGVIGLRLSMER